MHNVFDEMERDQEANAWRCLFDAFPAGEKSSTCETIAVADLFSLNLRRNLGSLFLRMRREASNTIFITPEGMLDIATEDMERGRLKLELNVDECPAVYVFVNLHEEYVLKVGQADNLRNRFCGGHLRYGKRNVESDLIAFCSREGWEWPRCLTQMEIAMLAFPMYQSSPEDRSIIEIALQGTLHPRMS